MCVENGQQKYTTHNRKERTFEQKLITLIKRYQIMQLEAITRDRPIYKYHKDEKESAKTYHRQTVIYKIFYGTNKRPISHKRI